MNADTPRDSPGDARRAVVLLYAAVQFLVLTVAAMFVYPGGAKYDLDSDRYRFFGNFFSDLGATETYSGHGNTASHVLFIVALASIGLALIYFSPAWRLVTAGRGLASGVGLASQALAVLSGIGFIGVALTPWDRVLDAHNAFVRMAFGLLLLYVICLVAIQARNGWPRRYVYANLAYLAVLAVYVVVLFVGPDLDTRDGLEFQVAAQKIIVYTSIVALGLQSYGVLAVATGRESAAG